MNDLSALPLADLFHQDPQIVEVDGYSVIPSQAGLCHNQPLFLHNETGRWCTFAGISTVGLSIRYLDGSYAHGVPTADVSNLGIQA